MEIRRTLPALLLAVSATAAAAQTEPPFHADGRHPPPSVERMAMANIAAELLSQQTGRSAAEIASLLETAPPHKVAAQLGLDEEAFRGLHRTVRTTLIQRAADTGLITPEQAETLRAGPVPEKPRPSP